MCRLKSQGEKVFHGGIPTVASAYLRPLDWKGSPGPIPAALGSNIIYSPIQTSCASSQLHFSCFHSSFQAAAPELPSSDG